MKLLNSLAGGLAGAVSMTILHELTRKLAPATAPRLDKLETQATARLLENSGLHSLTQPGLNKTALAGDIIGNTLYYSLAGTKINKAMSTGGLLGLSAGIGALQLPGILGLGNRHTNNSPKQRWLTIGLYVAGGLIAAGVTKWLEKKATKRVEAAPAYSPQEAYKPILDITV